MSQFHQPGWAANGAPQPASPTNSRHTPVAILGLIVGLFSLLQFIWMLIANNSPLNSLTEGWLWDYDPLSMLGLMLTVVTWGVGIVLLVLASIALAARSPGLFASVSMLAWMMIAIWVICTLLSLVDNIKDGYFADSFTFLFLRPTYYPMHGLSWTLLIALLIALVVISWKGSPTPGPGAGQPAPEAPITFLVLVGETEHGPYPFPYLQQFATEGRVTPHTLVRVGSAPWAPAQKVFGLVFPPETPGGPL